MFLSVVAGALLFAPAVADDAAKAAYDAWLAKLASTNTVTGKLVIVPSQPSNPKTEFDVKLMRPNLFVVSGTHQQWISDGSKQWMYMPANKQYMSNDTPAPAPPLMHGFEPMYPASKNEAPSTYKMEEFQGKQYPAAVFNHANLKILVLIDPDSQTPRGWKQVMGDQTFAAEYKDLKLNVDLDRTAFAWTPPADAKVYEAPDYTKSLLAVGTQAPDFTLKNPKGGEINLKTASKGKKGTLINFWFYG